MVSFIISLLQDWAASFTHCFKQSLGKNSRILFWKWAERVVIPLPWNEAVLFGGISRVKLFLGERGKKKTSQWCLLPSPTLPSLEKRSCWGCAVSSGRVPVYLPVFLLQLRFCQIVSTTGKTLQGLKKKVSASHCNFVLNFLHVVLVYRGINATVQAVYWKMGL